MRATDNCTRRKFSAIRRQTGISLLELSIVLVITGIILAGLASGVDAQIEQRDRRQTRQQLEEIKQALLGFAVANGRLPCPDSTGNDGIEDRTGAVGSQTCINTISIGNLPWVTLGIGQFDAWQRNFAYGVTPGSVTPLTAGFAHDPPPAPVCPATMPPPPSTVSFDLCTIGTFDIRDSVGGAMVAQDIAAVVISYGRNGGLAPTTPDETENQNGDDVAVDRAYSSNPAQPFDDLVKFISANELMYIMLAGGVFR